MTTIEPRGEWLAFLEAEFARRTARVAWEADEDERRRQWFIEELQAIAGRLAVAAARYPLQSDDMSIAEMLACRWFLPEELMPAGLGSEEQIWAEYAARRKPRPPSAA